MTLWQWMAPAWRQDQPRDNPTRWSRAVEWFKLRNESFRDHRVFFRAAPRYALTAVVIFLLPGLLTIFDGPRWLIVASAVVLAILIYLAVYVLFHSLGAVEYEKELQAEKLHVALHRMEQANAIIEGDLRRARQIQHGLVPQGPRFPLADRCTVVTRFQPQMLVGGDFYDFKAIDDRRLAMIFGDVAGHGMSAAFVTGLVKTLFELEAVHFDRPAPMVAHINNLLARVLPSDSFAALIYAILDFDAGRMVYTNAGHHPSPWVIRPSTDGRAGVEALDHVHGIVCGVVADEVFPEDTVELVPGLTLALTTDGWLDTQNPQGERFGQHRLEEALRASGHQPLDQVLAELLARLEAFAAGATPTDDRAIVLLRVR